MHSGGIPVGFDLGHLPPYSPDLNPIEKLWSKAKAWQHRVGAKMFDALRNTVTAIMRAATPSACHNNLTSCA